MSLKVVVDQPSYTQTQALLTSVANVTHALKHSENIHH